MNDQEILDSEFGIEFKGSGVYLLNSSTNTGDNDNTVSRESNSDEKEKKKAQYRITHRILREGRYKMFIKINGVDIKGSPFNVIGKTMVTIPANEFGVENLILTKRMIQLPSGQKSRYEIGEPPK